MTSQKAPTRRPARRQGSGSSTAAPRARVTEGPATPRPLGSWVVWAGIAAALAAAIWLVVAGAAVDVNPAPSDRANQAATDLLEGLADQYEAVRSTRANQAATDRLQGLADRYEAVRSTRANQAATGRLQGLADQYGGR